MFDEIIKGVKKTKKRMTLGGNKWRGKLAEEGYSFSKKAAGDEVKRTGRGHDFSVRKVNILTGKKGRTKYVEVKSSKTG